MNLSPDAIAFLAAKGMTMDDLVEFVRLAEQRKDPTNADRQARHRERKRNAVTVTRDAPLDKEIPPKPPKEINPPLPPVIANAITPPTAENDDRVSADEVVEAWNSLARDLGLPLVAKLTDARRRKLACRIREHPFEDWAAALAAIRRSRFLQGDGPRGWRANFNFLLRPDTITNLLEGQFDEQTAAR